MDKDTVTRTYRLSYTTATRLKRLATEHQVYDSSLVDLLLAHALDAVDAGRLILRRRPVAWVIDTDKGW